MTILNREKGSDLQLIKVQYHRPKRADDGKYGKDGLTIVYRDLKTGKKHFHYTEEPEMIIYFAKEHVNITHPLNFIPIEDVDAVSVKYKDVTRAIAENLGPKYTEYYWDLIKSGRYGETRNLHKAKRVFSSDVDINDYIREKFIEQYNTSSLKITKAYIDIETDISNIRRFPTPGEVPINAITLVDMNTETSYTLILRDKTNPQIQQMEDNIDEVTREISAELNETFKLNLRYKMHFYDEDKEINMIADIFRIIHALKPDFVMAWNMAFDMPYIEARCIELGYNPSEIMTHPDFPIRETQFFVDNRRNITPENKGDYYDVSGYTVYLDQMNLYAAVRKGRGVLESLKLDDIGFNEANIRKYDYSHICSNLADLPKANFIAFIKYNIWDVLVQVVVENRTEDLDTLFYRQYQNATRYEKVFRQTIYLKNRARIEYKLQGYIMGNNINVSYGKRKDEDGDSDDEKFTGAVVGDPENNLPEGVEIGGVKSKYVFDNAMDFDFSSLYPSILEAFGICAHGQYGRLLIDDDPQWSYTDEKDEERYIRGGDFVDDLETQHWIHLTRKWFGIPSVSKIMEHFDKLVGNKDTSTPRLLTDPFIEYSTESEMI